MGDVYDTIAVYWLPTLIAVLMFGIGTAIGSWLARRAWTRRSFIDRVNVSVNLLDNGVLRLRTLVERPLQDLFFNRSTAEQLARAARRAAYGRSDGPFLALSTSVRSLVHTALLNRLSEYFIAGLLRRAAGLPTTETTYVLALTLEQRAPKTARKIRVVMINQDQLHALPPVTPALEDPAHATRFETLKAMAEIDRVAPERLLRLVVYT